MRGEASAVFGGLIGTIAHFLILYGVAPMVGYQAEPFVNIAGLSGAIAAFSVYLIALGTVYPLLYHYAYDYIPGGVSVAGLVLAVPVWVAFVALDCMTAESVVRCAAVAGLAALAYGYLTSFSHVEFSSDF